MNAFSPSPWAHGFDWLEFRMRSIVFRMRNRKATLPTSLPLFERVTRSAIVMLVVRRLDDGRWVRVPNTFTLTELADREAFRARFGGGKYEVIGRDALRIVARTTFVLEGPARPLAKDEPTTQRAEANREYPFATHEGARQAHVYALLNEGLGCTSVTLRTGIDDDAVREIYLRWLTPDGGVRPSTSDEIERLQRLRAEQLETNGRASKNKPFDDAIEREPGTDLLLH